MSKYIELGLVIHQHASSIPLGEYYYHLRIWMDISSHIKWQSIFLDWNATSIFWVLKPPFFSDFNPEWPWIKHPPTNSCGVADHPFTEESPATAAYSRIFILRKNHHISSHKKRGFIPHVFFPEKKKEKHGNVRGGKTSQPGPGHIKGGHHECDGAQQHDLGSGYPWIPEPVKNNSIGKQNRTFYGPHWITTDILY